MLSFIIECFDINVNVLLFVVVSSCSFCRILLGMMIWLGCGLIFVSVLLRLKN